MAKDLDFEGHSAPSHGGVGIHAILKAACEQETYNFLDCNPDPGTPAATFGRLCDAAEEITGKAKKEYLERLEALSKDMEDDGGGDGPAAAGMTFLGQFIDHDLTLDATTELGHAAGDVTQIRNFRTPRLDLDCVYGGGPEVSPYLFDQRESHRGAMLFGTDDNALDLQRNSQGRALIGDPRNDENLFVSQIHGRKFVARHNYYADKHRGGEPDGKKVYMAAREDMTAEYHHMILHEFLGSVIDKDVLQPFLDWFHGGAAPKTKKFSWDQIPDMPVEFSAAAYRFGHSMVRRRYRIDGRKSADIFGDDLTGFVPVKSANIIDPDLFFGENAQPSRPIDTKLPKPLFNLPVEVVGKNGEPNLAFRNMDRGQITFRLPTGEAMANALGYPVIDTHPLAEKHGFAGSAPLWFYILAEAESDVDKEPGKLGPLGGSIVAGVLVNLLRKENSPLMSRAYA